MQIVYKSFDGQEFDNEMACKKSDIDFLNNVLNQFYQQKQSFKQKILPEAFKIYQEAKAITYEAYKTSHPKYSKREAKAMYTLDKLNSFFSLREKIKEYKNIISSIKSNKELLDDIKQNYVEIIDEDK